MARNLWTCIATCGDCGKEIGRAEHVPESNRFMVGLSAPLNCLCDNPKHNTFSDCNLRAKLEWIEEADLEQPAPIAESAHGC